MQNFLGGEPTVPLHSFSFSSAQASIQTAQIRHCKLPSFYCMLLIQAHHRVPEQTRKQTIPKTVGKGLNFLSNDKEHGLPGTPTME